MKAPDQAQAILDGLVNEISTSWATRHEPLPQILYHYTSADGLIGILRTKSIWLTDLRYMNDLSELQYARELVTKCLTARRTATGLTDLHREFLGRALSTFDPFAMGFSVFSISFCEEGNLLSQWRAYRGRGGGYAIGLDFSHLIRLLDRPCVLRRVFYDEATQSQIVESIIDVFLTALGDQSSCRDAKDVENDFLPKLCQSFRAVMAEVLFAFKHPDFREEKEWRLVHFASINPTHDRTGPKLEFRSYEGNVIPYFAVKLDKAIQASLDDTLGYGFPIVDLMIGPTVNANLNEESVRLLLLSLNPDFTPHIRHSGIPLRWL